MVANLPNNILIISFLSLPFCENLRYLREKKYFAQISQIYEDLNCNNVKGGYSYSATFVALFPHNQISHNKFISAWRNISEFRNESALYT
jgi:hypothetical protein